MPLKNNPAAIVAPPALAVALIVCAALVAVGVPIAVAAAPGLAAGVLVSVWLWSRAPQSAIRALGARPLRHGDHPRLENLIEGLCTTHGFPQPSIHVVDSPAVNAATAGLSGAPGHLVLTRGALVGLDRLELEAVVARQLCETRRGVVAGTVLASVAKIPGARLFTTPLTAQTRGFSAVTEVDLEAVQLTGFPPGLATALRKALAGADTEAAAAVAHLWLIPPTGSHGTRSETGQRIDLLGEV